MKSGIRIDEKGAFKLRQQLGFLKLSNKKKRWIHGALARKVRVYSRARLRAQQGLDGKPWERRKSGKKKRMLAKMSKNINAWGFEDRGEVNISTRLIGKIAKIHQEGIDQTRKASMQRKLHGKPDYKAPATRKQALALRRNGYRARVNGKRFSKPSTAWIIENLKLGQAGLILKILRNQKPATNWKIEIPERSFLGVGRGESRKLLNMASDLILKYGSPTKF